eukprot:UN00889
MKISDKDLEKMMKPYDDDMKDLFKTGEEEFNIESLVGSFKNFMNATSDIDGVDGKMTEQENQELKGLDEDFMNLMHHNR